VGKTVREPARAGDNLLREHRRRIGDLETALRRFRPPLVSSLPDPDLGREVYFLAATGRRWHLVCDDPEGAYPWAAVGGGSLSAYVEGSQALTLSSWVTTGGPTVSIPLPGIHDLDLTAMAFDGAGGGGAAMSVENLGVDRDDAQVITSSSGTNTTQVLAGGRTIECTSSGTLTASYFAFANSQSVSRRTIRVRPVRVAAA